MKNFYKKLLVTTFLFLIILSCKGVTNDLKDQPQPVINPAQFSGLTELQNDIHSIAKNETPAVVFISTEKTVVQNQIDPFDFFFGNPFGQNNSQPKTREYKQSALGSGVIFDKKNNKYFIMTNNHVVDGADSIKVTINQAKTYKGKVLGTDPSVDIAIVEITTNDNLITAKLGDSSGVGVGDFVVAVGNPFGLSNTLTFGIVSAIGRKNIQSDKVSLTDFIQTDAAINPGNSGGPLIDIQGDVIGINTLIYSQSGGSVGIGFAIPINIAKNIAYRLIENGKVEHGYLGIYYRGLTKDDIGTLGLKNIDGGMLITQVVKNSPAEKYGLKTGDVIIKVDNTELNSSSDLAIIIGNKEPGAKVVFTLLRENKTIEENVTLGKRPNEEVAQNKSMNQNNSQNKDEVVIEKYGFSAVDITSDVRKQYNLANNEEGVVITNVYNNTPAEANGLNAGDVIYKINSKNIKNVNDVVKISKEDSDMNYFYIKRGNSAFIVMM